MIARRVVLALPVFAFVTTAAAQALWLKVEGPERAFTFELPGTPEYKIQAPLHSYSLVRGPIEYVVQTVLYGPDVDLSHPRAAVQAALDGAAAHLAGGRWQQVFWQERYGTHSAEGTGLLKNGNALRYLAMLQGRRLVTLGMRGPTGTIRFPDAERFFASVRFAP